MSLDKSLKNLKYDVRMMEFNVNNGVISKEELATYLAQLPDSGSNALKVDLEEGASSSDDDIISESAH
jgi:hypothetical protein